MLACLKRSLKQGHARAECFLLFLSVVFEGAMPADEFYYFRFIINTRSGSSVTAQLGHTVASLIRGVLFFLLLFFTLLLILHVRLSDIRY